MAKRGKKSSFVPKFIFGTLCITSVVPACSSGSGGSNRSDASPDAAGGFAGQFSVAAGGFAGQFSVAAGGFGGLAVAAGGFGGSSVAAGGFAGSSVAAGGFAGAAGVAAGGFAGAAGVANPGFGGIDGGNASYRNPSDAERQGPYALAERRARKPSRGRRRRKS